MPEISFNDLKSQLEKAEKEGTSQVASLRSKINQAKEMLDAEIRIHQRQIDFSTKEFTVEHIARLYSEDLKEEKNELFIPDYQRDFKWDKKRQSKLIESLFLGLPIPYIFTADVRNEDDPEFDGRVEIVDGSQRIRTLYAFINNDLELQELKLLKRLNGFTFDDLPKSRQRRFRRIPIRVIELNEKCDEMTRRSLFERINSGSLELAEQEKRHGSTLADTRFYREVLTHCSDNKLFHELAPVSKVKEKSGEYKELALRFFSYLNNKDNYSGTVAPFLNDYLEGFKNDESFDAKEYNDEFNKTLSFIKEHFPHGFKKTENAKSTPRTRFEAIAVGAGLALREQPGLKPTDVTEWLYSNDFREATTSDGANNIGNFNTRLNFCKRPIVRGLKMEAIKDEFDQKIKEIEIFFELLENIDSEEICLKDDSILTDLNKILKASFFLMLYNMVESTMRESVVAIYDKIDSYGINFNQLRSKLRKKILGDCKSIIGIDSLHNGTSNDIAKELLKVSMSEKKLFSGNIDCDLIKKTALQYGFSYRTDPNRTKYGEKLRRIKDYRNDLAHGNLTFSEVGRSYDLNQLKEYKDETIAYVEIIVDNIDYYLRNQTYLSNPNGK